MSRRAADGRVMSLDPGVHYAMIRCDPDRVSLYAEEAPWQIRWSLRREEEASEIAAC